MLLLEVFPDNELIEGPIADRLKRAAVGGAVATGIGLGAVGLMPHADASIDRPGMERLVKDISTTQSEPSVTIPKTSTAKPMQILNKNNELLVAKTGFKAGLRGIELAAFLAQTAHESKGFSELKELGGEEYLRKMYDPKYAPKTAAIIGNVKPGDGIKYAGRGFIHLTGRDNYRMAGDAIGIDLIKRPELAAQPDIAAKIAVWYWKTRVRPVVKDFTDNNAVTRAINPALKHVDDRRATLAYYQTKL